MHIRSVSLDNRGWRIIKAAFHEFMYPSICAAVTLRHSRWYHLGETKQAQNRWSKTLVELDKRNPVKLGNRAKFPRDAAETTDDAIIYSVLDKSLAHRMEHEILKGCRKSHGDANFGNLSQRSQSIMDSLISRHDNDDRSVDDDYIRLSHRSKPGLYFHEVKIEKLVRQNKVIEAQRLFDDMMAMERIRPSTFLFSCLISGYARQGDISKSFNLYNQMKKMSVEPDGSVYTALFNACSKCVDPNVGLTKAKYLLGLLRHSNTVMTDITYRSAVKAFGVCGDTETAFVLADEAPPEEKYNSAMLSALLMTCCSDKIAGYQLAIAVWRDFRKRKVDLTAKHYNLLLRCVSNCGCGDVHSLRQLIQHGASTNLEHSTTEPGVTAPDHHHYLLDEHSNDGNRAVSISYTIADSNSTSHSTDNSSSVTLCTGQAPSCVTGNKTDVYGPIVDILNPKLKIHGDLLIGNMDTLTSRLILIGGVKGVLRRMRVHGCQPDIKTFFYLLRALPADSQSEDHLLLIMKDYQVRPDLDFLTYLCWRRAIRREHDTMTSIISELSLAGIQPNLKLFSILAMGCNSASKCLSFLSEMERFQMYPDISIFKNMLTSMRNINFELLITIIDSMDNYQLTPDSQMVRILSSWLKVGKHKLLQKEMRLDANNNRVNVDEDEINEDQVMILDRRCQALLICSKDAKT